MSALDLLGYQAVSINGHTILIGIVDDPGSDQGSPIIPGATKSSSSPIKRDDLVAPGMIFKRDDLVAPGMKIYRIYCETCAALVVPATLRPQVQIRWHATRSPGLHAGSDDLN